MAVYDTYSKRKRRELGLPEVYQYETIPHTLRTQIRNLWVDLYGDGDRQIGMQHEYNEFWRESRKRLAHERGTDTLSGEGDPFVDCCDFLRKGDTNDCLDIVQ